MIGISIIRNIVKLNRTNFLVGLNCIFMNVTPVFILEDKITKKIEIYLDHIMHPMLAGWSHRGSLTYQRKSTRIMRFTIYFTFIACYLLLLSGCSNNSNRYYPVKNLAPRENTLGFSISPPPGEDWYEKHKNNSLFYLKKTLPSSYAIYTKATEIHLDDPLLTPENILEYVKGRELKIMADSRYKNSTISLQQQQTPSPYCVRYQHRYEDHGMGNLTKNTFVQIKNSGLLCMHPDIPENGVEMFYQERSLSTSQPVSYRNEGELFLASLQFHPLSR